MSFSQQKWQSFTALNPLVTKSLRLSGFQRPTRIQAQVLNEFKHYYDFLIASQTGSGKTLAFALPIISDLLDFVKNSSLQQLPQVLLGLIITPTRELAQQIEQNISQVLKHIDSKLSVISIIGGMSKQKQLRIIRQRRPHIIIGTPGRIHEFLEDQVFNFQHLKYLVIDQADRIIQLGHYVEVDQILHKIFRPKLKEFYEKDFHQITQSILKKDKINQKNQTALYLKQNGKKIKIDFDLHSIQSDKLFQVPMELFQFVHADGTTEGGKIKTQNQQNIKTLEPQTGNFFREPTEQQLFWLNKLKRRIFFVSATLTRQFKGQKYSIKRKRDEQENMEGNFKKNSKKDKNKYKNKDKQGEKKDQPKDELESIPKLKALLSRVNFSSKPKIIDQSSELFLPAGLTQKISFTDGDAQKITLLICYLKSLPSQSKVIIFANTIKVSRRIQFFLEALGFKASNLHSHMQQKMRLTKLQRFKKSQTINILISTDVAARGLDFFVTNVVQYGVPLNGDTYVHRSGRTARANRTGEALIIVDRAEGNKWGQINDILNSSVPNRKVDKFCPPKVQMDEIKDKIQQLEWIRVNNERQKDVRNEKIEEMQAEQLGVEPQEQQQRRKYDLDKEQEQIIRHEVKKKVQKIRKQTTLSDPLENNIKWKKNKLVLSPQEIMKMM